ncbi:MAG: DUF4258 domain-containing protein [Deltaproteobacteria bacterium]|nr:DUF4258 domain-containing protein [Deltaproteobacteria bacterium]
MNDRHRIPIDPLSYIQRCIKERKIFWTYHVTMRLKERFINRNEILDSVSQFEIIEEYPDDKYFPSYLVYSWNKGNIFHVQFAIDMPGNNIRVITAYQPDSQEWNEDFKTRRPSK